MTTTRTALSFRMLRSREAVLALRPNYSTLAGLKVGAFAAFNPLKDGNSAQFEVRAFSVEDVGHEDPVTGSLNAGLAQWLVGSRIAPSEYIVSQGTVLKRMGRVYVEVNGSHIWVGGTVRTCVMAAGILDQAINHDEVLETGKRVQKQFEALLRAVLPRIDADVAV